MSYNDPYLKLNTKEEKLQYIEENILVYKARANDPLLIRSGIQRATSNLCLVRFEGLKKKVMIEESLI